MGIYYTSSGERKNHSRDAYRLLNYVLKKEYGIADAVIEKTPEGKPYISNHPEVYISISHTDGYVMCAVHVLPIGIDLQYHRKVSEGVIRRACNEDELIYFDFYSLWTLKESYIKLIGMLEGTYKDIVFHSDGDKPVCFNGDVSCRLFDILPDYSCAVCCFGECLEEKPIFILDIDAPM